MASGSLICGRIIVALLGVPALGSAANLVEVYDTALKNDPQIRKADAMRLANREAKPQALADFLPKLSATGTLAQVEQDRSNTSLINSVPLDPNSPLVPRTITTEASLDSTYYQVSLRQTIFNWDRWAALGRANAKVAQAEADYVSALHSLALRAAKAYFEVLAAADTVRASEAATEAFARQLYQSERRFSVGLIGVTDVQESRAAHDQAVAAEIDAKRMHAEAREVLRELTGQDFETLASPANDFPLVEPDPLDANRWVEMALKQNPDIISARLAAEIARKDVEIARSAHLPSIELVASRQSQVYEGTQVGRNSLNGSSTRSGADQDQLSDSIGIQVTFDLFSGGSTSSAVRQQVQLQRAARESLEAANRETERSTRGAYLSVMSEISRFKALRQAVESSRLALEATETGLGVGSRTTIDVLEARRRFFDVQTRFARSRYDYMIKTLELQAAAGLLSERNLAELNRWLAE